MALQSTTASRRNIKDVSVHDGIFGLALHEDEDRLMQLGDRLESLATVLTTVAYDESLGIEGRQIVRHAAWCCEDLAALAIGYEHERAPDFIPPHKRRIEEGGL